MIAERPLLHLTDADRALTTAANRVNGGIPT